MNRKELIARLDAIAPAVEALACHQEQCDEDGVLVKVSRQAVDEVVNSISNIAIALHAQADSASTPAWDVHGVISFVDELIGEDCNDECRALVRKTIARLATPSSERTSDGVRIQARPMGGEWIDIFPSQLEWASSEGYAIRAIESAALSSTPADALPGTEQRHG